MTEFFPREAAAEPEDFTGERLTSALSGQTQIEHYHRYLFARGFCAGQDVLDVASGEGYGSAQVAQVARSVVGLEFSASTVRSATANFPRPNLTFMQGDARAMPLATASFDLVISFETIEHFDRQTEFVAEVRRVLRPGGRFIVSTPDREVYASAERGPNPFHVKELSRGEFTALLQTQFPFVACALQRPVIGSVIAGELAARASPVIFDRAGPGEFAVGGTVPRAPYIIAMAGDQPIETLPASVFIDRDDLDTDRLALDARVAELKERSAELNTRTAELGLADLAKQRAVRERAEAEARIAALAWELDHIRGSARTFLRHYMPRLLRHLRGRLPR